jgi:tetratricopeptide (TPR) repeat protein
VSLPSWHRPATPLLLAAALAAAGSAAAERQSDPALQSFAVAYGAYRDGLDRLAEEQLRAFLTGYPSHERACEAWFLLGELLCRDGRRGECLEAYAQAYAPERKCSLATDARMHAAAQLRAASEPDRALELLLAVLRTGPPERACEAALGASEILLPRRDWPQMQQIARRALERCPASQPMAAYRAMASAALGQHAEAVAAATQALDGGVEPALGRRMLLLRGESHFRLDALSKAVEDLEAALEHEASEGGDVLLARARIRLGPAQAAVEAVDRLERRHPAHPALPEIRRSLLEALLREPPALLRPQLEELRPGDLRPEAALALAAALRGLDRPDEAATLLGSCSEPPCRLALAASLLQAGRAQGALALVEALAGQQAEAEDERRLLLCAALVELGRPEEAIAVYGDVAATAAAVQTAQRALFLQAQLHAARDEWPQALVSLQSLLVRGPAAELDLPARRMLAAAFLRSGQPARAATVLQELLPRSGGELQRELLEQLARVTSEQGDFAQAARHLERLLEHLTSGSEAWSRTVLELAAAYLRTGAGDKARRLLGRAAGEVPPDSPEGRELLLGSAALYEAEGSHNLAAEQYERLLPSAVSTHERESLSLRLGAAYYRTERFAEAIEVLREVDAQGPHGLATLLELGLCHERLGQLEQAARTFGRLLASSPQREEAALHLLRLAGRARQAGRNDLAAGLLHKVLDSAVPALLPEARYELAAIELEAGRGREALERLEQNWRREPVEGRWAGLSLLRAAATREAEGRWELAESLYRELLDRFPADPMAPYARGRLRQVRSQAGRHSGLGKEPADRPAPEDTALVRDEG